MRKLEPKFNTFLIPIPTTNILIKLCINKKVILITHYHLLRYHQRGLAQWINCAVRVKCYKCTCTWFFPMNKNKVSINIKWPSIRYLHISNPFCSRFKKQRQAVSILAEVWRVIMTKSHHLHDTQMNKNFSKRRMCR